MTGTNMTVDQAHEMATALGAMHVEAQVRRHDYAPKNPDGSYTGEVLARYSVSCVLRDPRHGNTVVRDLREPCDLAATVDGMRREIVALAKETRARIRVERSTNRS